MKQVHETENPHNNFAEKEQYRIIIWGAGETAREALRRKSDTVEVLGFLDNNPDIKEFEGLQALEKDRIYEDDYDYIVICSQAYKEIYSQLLERRGGKS